MLIGFSLCNYKSFNEVQTISFIASKVIRHKDHIIENNNKRILKSGLIFGANASGKSNLIEAIDFSRKIILYDIEKVNTVKSYFRINNDAYKQPGIFDYRIIVEGNEYSYGIAISYVKKEIIGEWLTQIDEKGNEIYLFNREIDEQGIYHTSTEFKNLNTEEDLKLNFYLDGFGENISDSYKKKTILNDIALRTNEIDGFFGTIKKIYNWFDNLTIIFPTSKFLGTNEYSGIEEVREVFSKTISFFDTGIETVENTKEQFNFDKILDHSNDINVDKIKTEIYNAVKSNPVRFKFNNQIYILKQDDNGNIVYNKMLLNHGNKNDLFEFADESDGTKRLFDLIPLFYLKKECPTILIDEIDRSLHTNLTKKFIEMFFSLTKNTNCQIIATTHDTNLLDLDIFRQDEIWFIERQKDHSSKLYSLNKFKARFDKKIDKDYLLGRYGAIPIFNNNNFLEEIYEEQI